MNKPKLLLITAISPFPTDSGGSVRVWHTLDNLAQKYEIHFFSFKPINYQLSHNEKQFLRRKTHFFYFFDLFDERNFNDFFSHGQPFWFTPWYSDELKLFISNYVKFNDISFAQVEFTQLLYLIDVLPKNIQATFVAHDISTISFFRRAQETIFSKKKFLFFILCLQIWWYEKKYLPKYRHVIAMSHSDKKTLQQHYGVKNAIVVPNGIEYVESKFIKLMRHKPIKLGYIGAFAHPPNEMAVRFFITKIAPLLEKSGLNYQFFYVGKNDFCLFQTIIGEAHLKEPERIINLGFVDNAADFYHQIDCLVTPIFSGSGTRLKILEALGYGLPVISTSIGAEGIILQSEQLQCANSAIEFQQKIIICDEQLRQGIKYDNQDLKKQYLWKEIFNVYLEKDKK